MEKATYNLVWKRFKRHPGAIIGLTVIVFIGIGILLAPLSPYDPKHNVIEEKLQQPSYLHPMGTDMLGRDVLTRVLYGGRLSLQISLGAMFVSLCLGIPIGVISGLNGGWIDSFLMRFTDIFLSFPSLFALIIISAMLREYDVRFLANGQPLTIVLAIGFLSWMSLARLVRASCLELRGKDFILASHSLGANKIRIVVNHILPNLAGIIIVSATLQIASAILIESGLSFIGFGVHPRNPTWGNMLNDAQGYIIDYPWVAIFPSVALFLTIISINFIGDGLRDALDPFSAVFQNKG